MKFESIPLWKGVSKNEGDYKAFPFSMQVDKNGLLIQSTDANVLNKVFESYHDAEYGFITKPPGFSEWATKLGELYFDFIKRALSGFSGKNIIEVGPGNLYMVEKILESGAEKCTVVDPALIQIENNNQKIKIYPNRFDEFHSDEKYDAVIALNCLEHLPDPYAFLRQAKSYLKDKSSRILLVFPDAEDFFRRGDYNVFIHEHISYFTPQSATLVFQKCGLEAETIFSKEDTLYCVLKSNDDNNKKIIENNKEAESFNFSAEIFSKALENFKWLISESRKGKNVHFHGATNGLNILAHLAGVKSTDTISLYDGDSSKWGMYLPALHKKVQSPKAEDYANCDYFIISAMSYYSTIYESVIDRYPQLKNKIQGISQPPTEIK